MPNRPSPPSPENERALIEWLLRYGRDFEIARTICASTLDLTFALFREEAEKELCEHNSHEALRARNDRSYQLFAQRFLPALKYDIRNIRFLDQTEQGYVLQLFVTMTLLDYILLYKYKDELLAALSEETNFGLEELYEPNPGDRPTQVTARLHHLVR
jgi:phytoene dehydrogenase-like protein